MSADLVVKSVEVSYDLIERDMYGTPSKYEPSYRVTFVVQMNNNTSEFTCDVQTDQGYTVAVADAARELAASAHQLAELATEMVNSPLPTSRATYAPVPTK